MSWVDPTAPVSGTVITVAWAVANIINPLAWLRVMTGGAQPVGADYVIMSAGTSSSSWQKINTPSILDGVVTDAKLASQKVAQISPTYTSFTAAQAGLSGFFDINNPTDTAPTAATRWHLIQASLPGASNYVLQFTSAVAVPSSVYLREVVAGTASAWRKLGGNANGDIPINNGTVCTNLNAEKLGGLTSAYLVPSGLIAAFANAGSIASGWTRFTSLDGRIPVGAGTTFSQTFTEGASAGSSWAHQHGATGLSTAGASGGAVNSGGGSTASPTGHTHALSGNTADTSWIPPSFAVVWASKA